MEQDSNLKGRGEHNGALRDHSSYAAKCEDSDVTCVFEKDLKVIDNNGKTYDSNVNSMATGDRSDSDCSIPEAPFDGSSVISSSKSEKDEVFESQSETKRSKLKVIDASLGSKYKQGDLMKQGKDASQNGKTQIISNYLNTLNESTASDLSASEDKESESDPSEIRNKILVQVHDPQTKSRHVTYQTTLLSKPVSYQKLQADRILKRKLNRDEKSEEFIARKSQVTRGIIQENKKKSLKMENVSKSRKTVGTIYLKSGKKNQVSMEDNEGGSSEWVKCPYCTFSGKIDQEALFHHLNMTHCMNTVSVTCPETDCEKTFSAVQYRVSYWKHVNSKHGMRVKSTGKCERDAGQIHW